jgi:hypothetical protein
MTASINNVISIEISQLVHTWLIDIDGTIFTHNPHLSEEDHACITGENDDLDIEPQDTLLPGVAEFWSSLPAEDFVILLSARHPRYRSMTEGALLSYGLRYDQILFGLPKGERILLNDAKPGGLRTAHAVNLKRDSGLSRFSFITNPTL